MAIGANRADAGAVVVVDGVLIFLVYVVVHFMARDTELLRVGPFHDGVEAAPEQDAREEADHEQRQHSALSARPVQSRAEPGANPRGDSLPLEYPVLGVSFPLRDEFPAHKGRGVSGKFTADGKEPPSRNKPLLGKCLHHLLWRVDRAQGGWVAPTHVMLVFLHRGEGDHQVLEGR